MKKLFEKYTWMKPVLGTLLMITGIATVILAVMNREQVSDTLIYVFAGVTIVFGGIFIVISLIGETRLAFTGSLVFGSILIALGIASLMDGNFFSPLLVNLLSVLLIVIGGACIAKAIFCIIYLMRKFYIFLLFLAATITTPLGILALCFKEYAFISIFIAVGALLIAIGCFEVFTVFKKMEEKEAPKGATNQKE